MSLFPNKNRKRRSNYLEQEVTLEHFCIFCYKNCDSVSTADNDLFFKLLGRFVGKSEGFMPISSSFVGCCQDCGVILGSFCEVYHQLKVLELQLEWKLESLVNIMRLANRVPSRVQKLKDILEETESRDGGDDDQEKVINRLKTLKNFRTNLIRKSTRRLSISQPRVVLERKVESSPSYLPTTPPVVRLNCGGEKNDNLDLENTQNTKMAFQIFLGWVFSVFAVAMAASASHPTSQFKFSENNDLNQPQLEETALVVEEEEFSDDWDFNDNMDVEQEGVVEDGFGGENKAISLSGREHFADLEKSIQTQLPGAASSSTDKLFAKLETVVLKNVNNNLQTIVAVTVHSDDNVNTTGSYINQDNQTFFENEVSPQPSSPKAIKSEDSTFPDNQIYSCSICKKVYKTKSALNFHKKLKHSIVNNSSLLKTYQCIICKIYFKTYNILRGHIRSQRHQLMKKRFWKDQQHKLKLNIKVEPDNKIENLKVCENEDVPEMPEEPEVSIETQPEVVNQQPEEDLVTPTASCYSFRERRKRSYQQMETEEEVLSSNSSDESDADQDASSTSSSSHSDNDDDDVTTSNKRQKHTKSGKPKQKRKRYYIKNPKKESKYFKCKLDGCSIKSKPGQFSKERQIEHQKYHASGTFKCNFCETVEENVMRLANHELINHSKESSAHPQIIKCPRCDFKSQKMFSFRYHFAENHVPGFEANRKKLRLSLNYFQCNICNKNVLKKKREKHFQIFHSKPKRESKYFKCKLDGCSIKSKPGQFLKERQLEHQKYHALGQFKCNFCETVEENVMRLANHEFRMHSKKDPSCSTSSTSAPAEIVHCPRCDFETLRMGTYRYHFAENHVLGFESNRRKMRVALNIVECDICQVNVSKNDKEKHFKTWHDLSSGVDPENMLRCEVDGCPTYFIKQKPPLNFSSFMKKHVQKCHESLADDDLVGDVDTDGKLTCKFCGQKFLKVGGLRSHVKLYHTQGVTEAEKLETAVKIQSSHWICPSVKCTLSFKSIEELDNHQKLHGNFPCKFCDISEEYAPDLAIHEMEEHAFRDPDKLINESSGVKGGLITYFNCSRCPLNFRRRPTFLNHFVQKHLEVTGAGEVCPICKAEGVTTKNKSGERNSFLKTHFKYYHNTKRLIDPSKTFKCDECPAYFLRGNQLESHKISFHFQNKCPKCGKVFARMPNLKMHMASAHPDFNPFPSLLFLCEFGGCFRKFATEEELDRHKVIVKHGINNLEKESDKLVLCPKCGKELKEKALYRHMYNQHSEKTQICAECGKAFRMKANLDLHMLYHKGPDTWDFECSECGKKCATKQKLEEHVRTHTKEKPFQCQFCGEKYAHRHNWRNHVKTKHEEEYEKMEDVITIRTKDANWGMMSRKGSKKGDCIIAGVKQKINQSR